MSEWVCIVRVNTADDPGEELHRMIKDRNGDHGTTTTTQAFVYDDARDDRRSLILRPLPTSGLRPPGGVTSPE